MIPKDYWEYRTKFSIALAGLSWIEGYSRAHVEGKLPGWETMQVIVDKCIRTLKEVEEWPQHETGGAMGGSPAPDR